MTDIEPSSAAVPVTSKPARIVSVDALRGFDMFWIIGGGQVANALEGIGGGPVVSAITGQLKHVEWEGFHFYDGIFPLFLFLIGVSIVLSMDRLVAKVGPRKALVRIGRRSLLLFAIGVLYYGGLSRAWPDIQLSGVLPRIALCYFFAATLYVLLPRKGIVIATALCLVGYWALMTFLPFPDVDLEHGPLGKRGSQVEAKPAAELFDGAAKHAGSFAEGRNLTHYVDARWLPGRKRNLYYTNEGLLSTISAVATTLFGIMAGWILTSISFSERKKVIVLVSAGAVAIVLGCLWGLQFPVIKRIWTSSFCLVASGFSAVLLGAFYLVADVWREQKWCVPFLWIGSNALVVYLAVRFVDFDSIALLLVGGDVMRFFDRLHEGFGGLILAFVALSFPLLLVRFLYRNRIFIRL